MKSGDADPETRVREVINLYNDLNIKDIIEFHAREYINRAFGFLKKVSVDEERIKEMTNLTVSLIGRDH